MEDIADEQNQDDSKLNWLTKLQQESWQAEMLVSGGALIALISLIRNFETWGGQLIYSLNIDPFFITYPSKMLEWAMFILAEGFLVHLLMRGYWIGLLGVNFAYPSGISETKLKYKGRFAKLVYGRIDNQYLLKLDKLCSVAFGFTYLTLFVLLSTTIFVFALIVVFSINDYSKDPFLSSLTWMLGLSIAFMGGLMTIDFLLVNVFRRNRILAALTYPFYYVISLITFSFTYRKLYLTLISNTREFILPLIVVISIVFAVLWKDLGEVSTGFSRSIFPYRSMYKKPESILEVHNSPRDWFVLISVKHMPRTEDDMITFWNSNKPGEPIEKISDLSEDEQLRLFSNFYQIFIDNQRQTAVNWIPEVLEFDNFF